MILENKENIELKEYILKLEKENVQLKEMLMNSKSILETSKIIVNCSNLDCKFHEWRKGCQHKGGACSEKI